MRIGSIGYATEQGLGHLLKWFYTYGIITDVLLVRHPRHPHHEEWYPNSIEVSPKGVRGPEIETFLGKIDLMLFFETPFDWSLPILCRSHGVKTVLVPNYEWCPENLPHVFDLIIAPSILDRDYFPGSVFLPIPVDPSRWKQRMVARRFLHNAGHVGHREHKGTRQLLESLRMVKAPIEITVRCQYEGVIQKIVKSAEVGGDPRLSIEEGYLPYETLWDGYDVLIAPEKFNGLSLPLQEGYAAGMLVMTTDRYPANTWLPSAYTGDWQGYGPLNPLIPVKEYRKARVAGSCHEFDEAIVDPKAIAAKIDEWFGRDISGYSLQAKRWAEENSWEALKPQWRGVLEDCVNGLFVERIGNR